ncbi:MAG: hypothetical protein IIX88_07285, partial [Firmicutes bacterium]|nr:hypothetical protein [Bacillota bacterium]
GKYYEMVSTTADNRILVRRASDHIGGRLSYRQMRNYTIRRLANSASMGALKTVNNIDIHYQYADFSVATPGYWKLRAHNDFDNGQLVEVNGVPIREYHNKLVLKFDFSKLGDAFTDSVRMTLTNLLNEAFVTLFADNQPFISAVTPGNYTAPLTYSLTLEEGCESADKCIFIIEDSQLDIGLLVAVERNTDRIFQIISDYLIWNDEQISKCDRTSQTSVKKDKAVPFDIYEGTESDATKKNIIVRLIMRLVNLLKKKDGSETEATPADPESSETLTPRQKRKAERARKKEERLRKKTEKTASQEPSDQADTELPLSGEAEAITETPKEEEVTEDV